MKLRIRDLREDRDLTQKEVAALLHCDQSLYSKYERGERLLLLDLAIRLGRITMGYRWTTSPAAPPPPDRKKGADFRSFFIPPASTGYTVHRCRG